MTLSLNTKRNDHQLNVLRMRECQKSTSGCTKCKLSENRNKLVFGAGNPSAPIMIVSGPPGYHEDHLGVPLAGRSGQILKMALTRIGLNPKRDVFCTNVVKCRPLRDKKAGKLKIRSGQIEKCAPYLEWQIDIVRPAILVLHGKFASQTLLGDRRPLQQYVGSFRSFGHKAIALSTHNPAGLFGEREELIEEYMLHWQEVAFRLDLLGRIWRPDAACFKDNWSIP